MNFSHHQPISENIVLSSKVYYGNSFGDGDIIGIALDMDNGVIWFSKNGTWQNSATQSEIENGKEFCNLILHVPSVLFQYKIYQACIPRKKSENNK